jgi:putative ABC transport system substrate-binding protein
MRKTLSRLFLLLATFGVLAAEAMPAGAAQPVVAAIVTGNLPRYREAHDAFVSILDAGGAQGKFKIFVQTPNPDKMSLANAIRRAVAAGAKVLVTYGAPAAEVAKKEAHGTPVLFADVYDPVALGLVKSLAAPGVEMTGACSAVPLEQLVGHLLRVKQVKRVGVLFTASEPGSALQAGEMESLGKKNGFSVVKREVALGDSVSGALGGMLGQVEALYLTESVAVAPQAAEAVEQARLQGVPVISQIPRLGKSGAVINLEADPEEQGKLVAVHALQVLAGQKAFILPVRTPKKVELVVNRGVARQLSLPLPESLVAAADRVLD